MADLSNILKEQISVNISTLISKEVQINNICQLKKENLNTKYIGVNSKFESEKVNFELNYLVPANLSSFMFNIMMMNEGAEIDEEINEEKADAIKEIISTINGNNATAINGENFEDIGNIKITTNDYSLIEDLSNLDLVDNFINFKLIIEDKEFDFIVNFTEEAKTFFKELFSTQECLESNKEDENQEKKEEKDSNDDSNQNEENAQNEENSQSEESNKNEDKEQTESKEQNNNEQDKEKDEKQASEEKSDNQNQEQSSNEEDKTDIVNESDKEKESIQDLKKAKKLKLLIIIISVLLVLIVGGFAVAYFMGVFEPPPPPPKKIHKNPRKNRLLKIEIKDKKIDFKISMINVDRLNKRLSLLTKYEILDNDIIEKFKEEEKERLHKLKIQKLESFAKANKEESLKNIKKEDFSIEDRFVYIQIEPLKYKQYKKIIDSKLPPKSNISICLDKNKKAQIYVGPLLDKEKANILVKDIKAIDHKNDTKLISLTKEEFDKLCDF